MFNENLTKSKAFSIRSIMNSPLKELLFDAINAPSGSTKKTRAKAILKSFQQSHNNFLMAKMAMDGQGGAGLTGLDVSGNLPLAKYAPKYTGQPLTLSPTGTVNPTAITARPTPAATSLTLPSTPRTLTPSPVSQPLTVSPTGSLVPTIPGTEPTTKPISRVSVMPPAPAPIAPTIPVVSIGGQSKNQWTQEGVNKLYNKYIASGYTTEEASRRVNELTSFNPVTLNPSKLTEDNAYDVLDNFANNYGTPTVKSIYESLSPEEQARLKVPYESVMSGEGPKSYSIRILSNKNLLGTILNLPKEVVDKFPDSGLLSDQINDLQDTVNKQFQLDEQLKNLTNLQNQGLTVKMDLQAYIRRKDEYLGKIDKMISDFDMKTSRLDTSDPNVAKRMDNYRNYLTILQGRQNQRYINYLDTAIESENAKLTQATNLYNLSLAQAEKAFTRAERVTTETYNTIKGMLEDQYKNIEDKTKILRDTETYELDRAMAISQLIEQQKKVAQMGNLPEGFSATVSKELNELQQGDLWGNVWNRIKMQFPTMDDKTINNAFRSGVFDSEEEAKKVNPEQVVELSNGKWAAGWARPGAYQEWATSKGASQKLISPDKLGKLRVMGISDELSLWIAEQFQSGVPESEIVTALGTNGQDILDNYKNIIIYGY